LRFSVVLGVRFLSVVYVCAGGDEKSAFFGGGLSGFEASARGREVHSFNIRVRSVVARRRRHRILH
jgi:hypothetical protein